MEKYLNLWTLYMVLLKLIWSGNCPNPPFLQFFFHVLWFIQWVIYSANTISVFWPKAGNKNKHLSKSRSLTFSADQIFTPAIISLSNKSMHLIIGYSVIIKISKGKKTCYLCWVCALSSAEYWSPCASLGHKPPVCPSRDILNSFVPCSVPCTW